MKYTEDKNILSRDSFARENSVFSFNNAQKYSNIQIALFIDATRPQRLKLYWKNSRGQCVTKCVDEGKDEKMTNDESETIKKFEQSSRKVTSTWNYSTLIISEF